MRIKLRSRYEMSSNSASKLNNSVSCRTKVITIHDQSTSSNQWTGDMVLLSAFVQLSLKKTQSFHSQEAINLKFLLVQPHQKFSHHTQYEELIEVWRAFSKLTQIADYYTTILTTSLIYISIEKVETMYFLDLGVKGLTKSVGELCSTIVRRKNGVQSR